MIHNRRSFLGYLASFPAFGLVHNLKIGENPLSAEKLPFATNEYSWITFSKRQGRDWFTDLDASLSELAKSGIKGYEPAIKKPEDLQQLAPLLKKHKLEMPSIYVGNTLHQEKEAAQSLAQTVAIAKAAKPLGLKIIVTNPSPIRWGGPENKSDAELTTQANYLNKIGAEVRKQGVTLAYHNHDIEMRNSAREFHHMMLATNPENVSLCLEAHWLYRGSGNSQLAMFDILRLYGSRVVEVHLRQSINGTWSETFKEGDIDYLKLAKELADLKINPHFVLEQCIESQTANTLDAVAAHQADLKYASNVFASFKNVKSSGVYKKQNESMK
ncbi:sugar phosphate isomerase/epimerase family protein [Adhaeribacter pallidiroseus]|uniref:Myo-inosose-2 dehydratase n=1 Tax=Adhaeribacter pallidiroseus TaxID=2072847 RepID=A0A369QFE1_9BACT|nr:sugar phosphate isomerase/epimerase [Adhaeribacter pallidiroseus]RDC61609.1 Myo-inosose-2 dehydratase [Adhaeribacter pallidiroseus]